MHQPKALKTAFLVSVTAAATTLLIQACGGGGTAVAQSKPDPIVGVWDVAVTQVDCTSGATVSTFHSLQVFQQGGTFADTSTHPTTVRGPAWGVWTAGSDSYTTKFRFFRYAPDSNNVPAYVGSSASTMTVTVAADGNTFTAHRTTKVLDPSGNQVAQVCTNDAGTRFN
jgi:hypothetical protein